MIAPSRDAELLHQCRHQCDRAQQERETLRTAAKTAAEKIRAALDVDDEQVADLVAIERALDDLEFAAR